MKIGVSIKEFLKNSGIKQSWLAEQLKISASTLSTNLSSDMSATRFFEICSILNISPEYFFEKCRAKGGS